MTTEEFAAALLRLVTEGSDSAVPVEDMMAVLEDMLEAMSEALT